MEAHLNEDHLVEAHLEKDQHHHHLEETFIPRAYLHLADLWEDHL